MGRKRLSSKEEILRVIRSWVIEHGMAPTVEELRQSLGLGSTRTALRYLRWLEDEGEIERWPGARGLRLLKAPAQGLETTSVPLVGEAPAGPLMVAEGNIEGWVRLPQEFSKPKSSDFFLIRVRGSSMNRARVAGELIEHGDLLLVRRESTAEPGQIVVVIADGQATVKRLIKGPGYYILQPESTDRRHRPIIVDGDFGIQGVVCRVFKKGSEILQTLWDEP